MIEKLSRLQTIKQYNDMLAQATEFGPEALRLTYRKLSNMDLFFMMGWTLGRIDIAKKDWLFERCREVQAAPDGYIDLWAREHYKSTIITYGMTIFELMIDPELTFGIFSHTKSIAKDFLKQIKREFEGNQILRQAFPDIIWENPKRDAPSWSEDSGIILRRKFNPKEASVEAHGLVDGQPTGKHFMRLIYDDVVTRTSVYTSDQIENTTSAYKLSLNLGADGGTKRIIGTRYHYNDTYAQIMKDNPDIRQRIYPATDDGTATGNPVLLSKKKLETKRAEMGQYIFACQMLQDPRQDSVDGFKEEWLRFYAASEKIPYCNTYVIVDPANTKKNTSDYSVFWVVGYGIDKKIYAKEIIRDRFNLTERTKVLFSLVRKYKPIRVGYEHYGMQADIEHIHEKMGEEGYRFSLTPLGGNMPKNDRIRRLIPYFENSSIYLPEFRPYTRGDGRRVDIIDEFKNEEYLAFPHSAHDDMLDGLARMIDLECRFPSMNDISEMSTYRPYRARTEYDPATFGMM